MLDTGSSHSLISKECLNQLHPSSYIETPISLNMICAGGIMKDNITAHTKLKLEFITKSGKILKITQDFLICKKLSLDLILGDNFLCYATFTPNLTPSTIYFMDKKTHKYEGVDLVSKSSNPNERIGFLPTTLTLEPETTILTDIIFNNKPNHPMNIFIDKINNTNQYVIQPCSSAL